MSEMCNMPAEGTASMISGCSPSGYWEVRSGGSDDSDSLTWSALMMAAATGSHHRPNALKGR